MYKNMHKIGFPLLFINYKKQKEEDIFYSDLVWQMQLMLIIG